MSDEVEQRALKLIEPTSSLTKEGIDQSKIIDYGLADKVVDWYLQGGFTANRIAFLCNKELEVRTDKDTKNYLPINHSNVTHFLKSRHKEIEFAKDMSLAPMNQRATNILNTLDQTVNIINSEMEKIRHPDNPIADSKAPLFVDLLKRLTEVMELCASIQGKLQPAININVFQDNIKRFVDKINNNPEIPDKAKEIILNMIADDLINDNVLKVVSGEVKA